jgi:enoyl-CoA hydratase
MWAYRLGAQRAKRLLFTGDLLTGTEALDWGLAIEAPPAAELDAAAEQLAERIALMPINQLQMMKLLVNQSLYSQGLKPTEGFAFQQRAATDGFKAAVKDRDEPFDAPKPS